MVREKILLDQPGMCEITDFVTAEIGGSGIAEGVCVITVLDERAAVVAVKRERAEVRRDIMEDLERMFPPRVNYRVVEMMDESVYHAAEVENAAEVQTALSRTLPKKTAVTLKQAAVEAAARSKAAVTGGSLDVIVQDGCPAIPPDQGIFVAGYAGGLELEIVIMCG